jgi:hypothetical protein
MADDEDEIDFEALAPEHEEDYAAFQEWVDEMRDAIDDFEVDDVAGFLEDAVLCQNCEEVLVDADETCPACGLSMRAVADGEFDDEGTFRDDW